MSILKMLRHGVARVSAKWPVEYAKRALQNITAERMMHSVGTAPYL